MDFSTQSSTLINTWPSTQHRNSTPENNYTTTPCGGGATTQWRLVTTQWLHTTAQWLMKHWVSTHLLSWILGNIRTYGLGYSSLHNVQQVVATSKCRRFRVLTWNPLVRSPRLCWVRFCIHVPWISPEIRTPHFVKCSVAPTSRLGCCLFDRDGRGLQRAKRVTPANELNAMLITWT